jgi:hypothetical protein
MGYGIVLVGTRLFDDLPEQPLAALAAAIGVLKDHPTTDRPEPARAKDRRAAK